MGAILSQKPGGTGFDFIVERKRVETILPEEILYITVNSDKEAHSLVSQALNGPPILSNTLLAKLWLIPVIGKDCTSTTLDPMWHFVIHIRHCIVDGRTIYNMGRIFMELLTHNGLPPKYQHYNTFEEFLNLHPAIDNLNRHWDVLPRLRWRRAIAKVIQTLRDAPLKASDSIA